MTEIHSMCRARSTRRGLRSLSEMATAARLAQVPAMWAKAAYPSLKPLAAWMEDLVQRIKFVQEWVDGGPPPAYWISGFYFPQAFLTGTLQNYARKYTVAIDKVSFDFSVLDKEVKDLYEKPADGCYVYGLFLEGASWDAAKGCIVESRPKELYVTFPVLWLHPKVDRPLPEKKVYSCPVYKTLTRAGTLSTTGHSTNFVLAVELPSDEPCSGTFSRRVHRSDATESVCPGEGRRLGTAALSGHFVCAGTWRHSRSTGSSARSLSSARSTTRSYLTGKCFRRLLERAAPRGRRARRHVCCLA